MPLRPGTDSASKRKAHFADSASSGAAKRLRARRDARDILTQPGDAALNNGALDLAAFLATRHVEIAALEESMRLSKASRSQRAFQRVPRAMRRRTASHNHARVPKRLRARALREMHEDNTPRVTARRRRPRTTRARIRAEMAKRVPRLAAKRKRRREKAAATATAAADKQGSTDAQGDTAMASDLQPTAHTQTPQHSLGSRRPKIRRNALNQPLIPRSKFRKRQAKKTWLPTHIWHAKRARMSDAKQPLWRFAIPLRPNEKTFRATHRTLTDHGAMAWDTSYMSTVGVYGCPAGLQRVLKKIGLVAESLWNERGERWRKGVCSWSGMLTKNEDGAVKEVCPATVIWNPVEAAAKGAEAEAAAHKRQVFIRVHPAAFDELFDLLLRHRRMETPKVYIEDLRFEIGSIEITGPAAVDALLSALKPYYPRATAGSHARMFTSLAGLTNPATLPAGAVLAFDTADARLHYPPRLTAAPSSPTALMDTLEHWNITAEAQLQPYRLWDRDARYTASCLPPKKTIDRRKAAHAPGQPLPPTPSDPPIPVILLASRSGTGSRATGSLSLLLPWACVQPLWHSLMHVPLRSGGTPRFGGLRETAQAHDERGLLLFPRDYPATRAGAALERDLRAQRERDWTKRPTGKRTAWNAVNLGAGRRGELGSPYACDYELLFDACMHVEAPPAERVFALEKMVAVDARRYLAAEAPPRAMPLFGVVRVRITFFSQGIAQPTARVYRLPSAGSGSGSGSGAGAAAMGSGDAVEAVASQSSEQPVLPSTLRQQWLSLAAGSMQPATASARRPVRVKKDALAAHMVHGPAASSRDVSGHPLCPGAGDLLGFVTAGGYSLACGKATAVATLRADWALRDVRAATSKRQEREAFLCVVRNVGREVAWIARWELLH